MGMFASLSCCHTSESLKVRSRILIYPKFKEHREDLGFSCLNISFPSIAIIFASCKKIKASWWCWTGKEGPSLPTSICRGFVLWWIFCHLHIYPDICSLGEAAEYQNYNISTATAHPLLPHKKNHFPSGDSIHISFKDSRRVFKVWSGTRCSTTAQSLMSAIRKFCIRITSYSTR